MLAGILRENSRRREREADYLEKERRSAV